MIERVFIFCLGCIYGNVTNIILYINFYHMNDGLELSTLLSNYEMVQLETNQESLIGVNASVCITDKHGEIFHKYLVEIHINHKFTLM